MLQYSPKITTDGLVMCLDASQNKSYPTTDLPVKGGLLLWLDAADDSTFSYSSGTVVSQWRDKSGNNFHASQSTTSQQPSRNTTNNSRKSVFFNASSRLDYMTISSGISLPSDASIFIIYKPSTQVYNYAVLIDNYHGLGGSYGFVIQRVNNLSQFYYGNGNGSGFVDTSASPWTYTDNAIQLLSLNKLGATATPYISGTAQTSRTVYANTAQYTTALAIGYWGNGGGRFYNGDMCEILVFNRALSSTEMKQVHTYLGQKWGISNTDRSVIDLSGNNNHGLLGNGTTGNMPAFNYYNKSLTYNKGESDTLVVTNSASFKTNNITIELYMKFNSAIASNTGDYIQMGIGSGVGQFYFRNENPNLSWNWYPATSASSNLGYAISNFATDTYYLITLTGDSGGASRMYVNGSQVASAANVGSSITSWTTNNLTIGGYVWDGYSNTDIALTRIYNRVLSASEISQNYEAIKTRFTNTIVQQGLVLNIDAANPYSYGGAGTTVYDTSNTALSWTATNTTYNSDPIKYFSFNGSNSSLVSSTSTAYDSQTITMECWCYPTTVTQYGFLFEKGQVNTQYSMFFNADGTFFFRTMSISTQNLTFSSASYITANSWNHIVCTYGAGTKTVYINGTQGPQQTSLTGTLPTGQTNQYIGKYGAAGDNYPFNGRIAESRVYNIALSAAQVLQNYNATRTKYGL